MNSDTTVLELAKRGDGRGLETWLAANPILANTINGIADERVRVLLR